MVATVSSLGSPLVPLIARSYAVSVDDAQWSLTLVLVVGAVATPVVGRLGDGPRRREVLLAALVVLLLGNVCAALPGSFALFLTGRALQGAGLALTPLAMSIARDHLPVERTRSALASISVTAIVGLGLGYPLTGVIAEHASFHAAYWAAAALSAAAIVLVAVIVPPSGRTVRRPFDALGALILGVALTGLLLSISEGDAWGWLSLEFWVIICGSILLLAVWARHELRTDFALVNLHLMQHRAVLATNVTVTLAGICLYLIMPIIVIYVQTPKSVPYGLGASILMAGLVLVPFSAVSVVSSRLVTYLGRWVAADVLLPLGVLGMGVAMLLFWFARSELWENFLAMAVTGVGVGSVFAVAPRLIAAAVPAEETSSALAMTQVVRGIGFSVGSALTAAILATHTPRGSSLPSNSAYSVTAMVGVAVCVATATIGLMMRAPTRVAGAVPEDLKREIEESVDGATAGIPIYESDGPPTSALASSTRNPRSRVDRA